MDTAKAFGWTGGSFVLEGFYENADSLDTQYVGAAQDPSVIDTSGVAMFRLYQAYYKQDIGSTNVLFGIYDPGDRIRRYKADGCLFQRRLCVDHHA